ncbi:hypothetical protein SKAU_G00262560 [Synaphobranchus kaupii]|uniref:Uncharacterized protein n=1 Tax=Synaphobranchus kaupii TaxID=118154 RepID=A0A9Q1EYP2_SYNKA|nr:hypothetical protein SKAU_G00262560 [Synaphobranchus kaupii]
MADQAIPEPPFAHGLQQCELSRCVGVACKSISTMAPPLSPPACHGPPCLSTEAGGPAGHAAEALQELRSSPAP